MMIKRKLIPLYSKVNELVQAYKDNRQIRQASKQLVDLPELSNPFFMIGITGALHIMELSFRYVPTNVDLVLILNGMDEWEQEWAKQHFITKGTITIDSDHPIAHSKVLDMLFEGYSKPFGILDYDCFVFNPKCFAKIQSISSPSLLNALFEFRNTNVNLRLPHTFFLFFNSPVIKLLKNKYHIGSKITDFQAGLPPKVVHQLAKVGIDREHYPEAKKNYFDTLRLLICLGYSEGYVCNILDEFLTGPIPDSAAFHVGGVAHPNYTKGWWSMRGSYFWHRALELNENQELRRNYQEKFGVRKSTEIFDASPEWKEQTGQEFFDYVESFLLQETQS